MQEFKLDKNYITLMKGCLIVFVAFIAYGLALPFLPVKENANPNGTMIVSLMCIVVFSFFSVLTWRILKVLPYADVAADDDGIWYLHIGKTNGLISWKNITTVKERAYLQYLEILDYNGKRLLRVEYQLTGFQVLRNIIYRKMRQAILYKNDVQG